MFAVGAEEGRHGNYNQWVIDSLVEGDVVVADMYDNRSAYVDKNNANRTVETILDFHRLNLL